MEDDWVMTESNQKAQEGANLLDLNSIKKDHFQQDPSKPEEEGGFLHIFLNSLFSSEKQ